jgi:MFS transporter, DHA1 family, multidrug resistance protein
MVGSFFLPVSLFIFGWTAQKSIHWIGAMKFISSCSSLKRGAVPIVGSSFFGIGTFYLFQAGLNYLGDCYPRYMASVLAGNDLFRSLVGAGFPLFSNRAFWTEHSHLAI